MARAIRRLSELAPLRDALARDAAEIESRAAEARRDVELAEREANLFRDHVGAVTPLATPPRARHAIRPPDPIAAQHARDEAAALAESMGDGPADAALDIDEQSSWHRPGIGRDVVAKLRRGHWIVQSEVDLHGARVDAAREIVAEFLREAVRRKHRCVRIVHGKGHGSVGRQPVLKGKVRRWLAQKAEVLAFCEPREHDGGSGALLVLLRPS